MNNLPAWNWAAAQVKAYRAQLRFCLRMTVAALLAFALTQLLAIPLHGLWAVLTAVVVTQVSVGGSLRATAEYVVGTLGGAAYASLVGVLVPHTTALALAGVLALTVAPLAGAAALSPSFRVAPFTAVIVLLISNELGEGPVESALYRLLEVALGGAVAVTVALLVFPERAWGSTRPPARLIDWRKSCTSCWWVFRASSTSTRSGASRTRPAKLSRTARRSPPRPSASALSTSRQSPILVPSREPC